MKLAEGSIYQLKKCLDEIIELLEWDGQAENWLRTMQEARQGLNYADLYGLEILLRSYGGMGSFNDLLIGQTYNGKTLEWKDDSEEKNNLLSLRREEAFQLAHEIKRRTKGT
jgi:hypothetical protein